MSVDKPRCPSLPKGKRLAADGRSALWQGFPAIFLTPVEALGHHPPRYLLPPPLAPHGRCAGNCRYERVHGGRWVLVWGAVGAWGSEMACFGEGEHGGRLQVEVKPCGGRSAPRLPAQIETKSEMLLLHQQIFRDTVVPPQKDPSIHLGTGSVGSPTIALRSRGFFWQLSCGKNTA